MNGTIQGTFHFHSTYSHDGKSTLPEIASTLRKLNLSFCVMTDHFEDFDARKFSQYIEELHETSKSSGFFFIPGIEVHLSGVDTILFPVQKYEDVARFEAEGVENQPYMFKVLAHPSKYHFDKIANHLARYRLDGIELWNQQADGRYIPPLGFWEQFRSLTQYNNYRVFFGCDLHNANLTVANVLSLPLSGPRTSDAIVAALMNGNFVSRNNPTEISFDNEKTEFDEWLRSLSKQSFHKGKALRGVRGCLRSFYKWLPRNAQHSLNDVKNFVRNKI